MAIALALPNVRWPVFYEAGGVGLPNASSYHPNTLGASIDCYQTLSIPFTHFGKYVS